MLRAALCGNYVNFGVFRLYGDDALDNALGMFVKLLLSISQSDLLVSMYPWALFLKKNGMKKSEQVYWVIIIYKVIIGSLVCSQSY